MKKIYAFLTAAVMILQSFTAFAADEIGWDVNLIGQTNIDTSKYFAMRSTEAEQIHCYDGSDALFVKYPGSTKSDTDYLLVTNTMKESTVAEEEYTLTFYIKGSKSSEYQEIMLGNEILTNFKALNSSATKITNAPSGQTAWYEMKYTFTAKSAENKLSFRFYGGTTTAAIDNVSLINADGEDLIENGGFEEALNEGDGAGEAEYDQTPYTPSILLATPRDSQIILNWKNPSSDKLVKISVYDITDGEENLLTDELNTTKSKSVFYPIKSLTNGASYQYKIVYSFSDKGDFAYYLGASPSGTEFEYYGAWTFNRRLIGAAGYCPAELNIDNNVAHSGNSSVHIVSNIDRTNYADFKSNIFTSPTNSIKGIEVGKKYRVSFWAKGENVTGVPEVNISQVPFDGHANNFCYDIVGTYDWKQLSYTYTCNKSGANTIRFDIADPAANLWIDDVEVYELDETGNIAENAENLIEDGGFEGLTNNTVGEITKLSAMSGMGKLNLTWKNPSDNYQKAEIYEKYFDKYLYRGTIAKNAESIELTSLKNGTEYTFRLVPVNAANIKGKPVEVTATVELPDYETGEVILKKEGMEVNGLSGMGTYSIMFSVKNNTLEDGMPVEQFVAVYDGNNVLYKVFSTQKTVKKTGLNKAYTTITTTFDIPDNNYTAEYFVFDGRNTLNIVGETNPHKVFTE